MVYNINVTKHYVKMEADFPYCSVLYKEKMAENRLKLAKIALKLTKWPKIWTYLPNIMIYINFHCKY